LTGIVLCTTTFFESEISITDFKIDSHACIQKNAKRINVPYEISQNIISDTVNNMIQLLLFSEKAHQAREMEKKRYDRKILGAFNKHVCGQRYKFHQYNIVEGLEFSMNAVSKFRKTQISEQVLSSTEANDIIKCIIEFIGKLHLPKPYILSHPTEKFNNLVTSIIYICADGICDNEITYLQKFSVLKNILCSN